MEIPVLLEVVAANKLPRKIPCNILGPILRKRPNYDININEKHISSVYRE